MFFSLLCTISHILFTKTRSEETWVKGAYLCVAKCYLSSFESCLIIKNYVGSCKINVTWYKYNIY